MSVENDFLPFAAASGANVIDQATYAALSALATGFQSGVASSAQINKVLRQASIMSAVLADLIVDKSGQPAIDDGTTATLVANLIAAIEAVAESVGLTQTQADARYAALAGLASQVFSVAAATAAAHALNAGQYTARALIQEVYASGTNGATSVAGVNVRSLNTVQKNNISGLSLASNQVTLPACSYFIRGGGCASQTDMHKAWLKNITDGTVAIVGQSIDASSSQSGNTWSMFEGFITLTASKVFQIQHYTQTASTYGMGRAVSSGQNEVYTTLEIIQLPL